jgi:hypothetical protein
VAGHQPHPRRTAPREPPAGPLRPLATPAMLLPSASRPHHAKPQERPPISVGSLRCPINKNNYKIYQMKQ